MGDYREGAIVEGATGEKLLYANALPFSPLVRSLHFSALSAVPKQLGGTSCLCFDAYYVSGASLGSAWLFGSSISSGKRFQLASRTRRLRG